MTEQSGDTKTTALATVEDYQPIIALVVDGLTSDHSRRAYEQALTDFLAWYDDQGRPRLSKAVVQSYKRELHGRGLAPSTINGRLTAIRRMAAEAADNDLLHASTAAAIGRVKGITAGGRRTGNWLDRERAQALLLAPDTSTLKGLRDRAILAVLLGTGLRRAEAARLTLEHIQQREGRWCIVDILGKRNKIRTVPMPSWCKVAMDAWIQAAGIESGRIFRPVNKGDRQRGESMTAQALRDAVMTYTAGEAAPHDLRRTFAKLAHKGGAGLDQISLTLGHESLKTTQDYLGLEQDLTDAPCDHLGLRINGGY